MDDGLWALILQVHCIAMTTKCNHKIILPTHTHTHIHTHTLHTHTHTHTTPHIHMHVTTPEPGISCKVSSVGNSWTKYKPTKRYWLDNPNEDNAHHFLSNR